MDLPWRLPWFRYVSVFDKYDWMITNTYSCSNAHWQSVCKIQMLPITGPSQYHHRSLKDELYISNRWIGRGDAIWTSPKYLYAGSLEQTESLLNVKLGWQMPINCPSAVSISEPPPASHHTYSFKTDVYGLSTLQFILGLGRSSPDVSNSDHEALS